MSIARYAIDKQLVIWLLMLGCLFGGIWGFETLGRLEDPAFTIKNAKVITSYPGASAEQVAREVSEPLESAIQKMGEVNTVTSLNLPGQSIIDVEIKDIYGGDELADIWTKLRNRVGDRAGDLPAGTGTPEVNDGFGDVYGLFYAVTAPGYSDAEIHQLSRFLRRELLTVDGVADIEVAGLPEEAIFVEPDFAISVNQNVPPQALLNAISTADSVAAAGAVDRGTDRTRIDAPDGSDTVSAIAGLSVGVNGEVFNLFDIAHVHRDRVDNPRRIIRINGQDAFTLAIAGIATDDIVKVGKRVDEKIAQLMPVVPYGIELVPIYQQHIVVEEASNDFLVSLALSVAIVVVVLALAMGWRAAIVVGATLLLTVVGSIFFMAIFSIEMERISLGALIIAMGMLVDNAIVVAEGMQIAMQNGRSSRDAAEETASKTQVPLLGATVIGIMAFSGIGLSPDSTGEFMFSLFAVICISLMLSWVLAITVTPLLGHYFFHQGEAGAGDSAYDGALFRAYGGFLGFALRQRWLMVMALIVVTAACYWGFGQVKQSFFPNSNTPLFFVHYKLPQGASINATSQDLQHIEEWLLQQENVVSVSTFVGGGATRFMLTYGAEDANPSYGHMIVRASSLEAIPPIASALEAKAASDLPNGEFRTERLVFGPGGGAQIQARFSGPDPVVLRELGEEAMARMRTASDDLRHLRQNWREQELVLKPIYATDRAQAAGVTRDDIASTLQLATDGLLAGVYREEDRQIPIYVRQSPDSDVGLTDQVVYSTNADSYLPLAQVIDGLTLEAQNTLVHRRDRVLTLTVEAGVPVELTAASVHSQIRNTIEAMEVPLGYTMEWGGEFENSSEANASLGSRLPISGLIMVLISILLFTALRQPLIIWLLVPMSVNGAVLGLLGTGLPFTFTALLGLLSLSGMLIKNGIVLVEEIDLVRAEGNALREAIVTASKSRLRPVVLAAATTILGMIPLLWDAFFVSMAVTIMGGLAFASILTLVAAPVLYDIMFSRDEAKRLAAATA